MITTDEGLRLALEQLGRVYRAAASLRSEHPRASDSWLAVMAEGWEDQARELEREIETYTGAAVRVEDHSGALREIDLDQRSMSVRNAADVPELRCTLDESLLEVAKGALDHRVRVFGVRQVGPGRMISPTLHVFRLEILDEPAPQAGPGATTAATHAT